jgi:hypothetical protein
MSQDITERLSRFTPDGSGLDRDALLFAAGQASVRASRRWPAVAGLLAASQVLTLTAVCLWPLVAARHAAAVSLATALTPPPAKVEPSPTAEPVFLRGTDDPTGALPADVLVPPDPPLYALAASPPRPD